MTAHRLNRTEYTNTIRDLLGVHFRAENDFPADDSSDGFDNIGDVLTVSPLLMERYMSAAERIARWAISTEIPAKPLEIGYLAARTANPPPRSQHHRSRASRRVPGRVHRPLRSARGAAADRWFRGGAGDARFLDGRQAAVDADRPKRNRPASCTSIRTPKKKSGLHLPEGDHVFRAGFIDDGFVKMLPRTRRTAAG